MLSHLFPADEKEVSCADTAIMHELFFTDQWS